MRKFSLVAFALVMALAATGVHAAGTLEDTTFEQRLNLMIDGQPWLGTVNTPVIDLGDTEHRYETYKVYTHVYDFDGEDVITKGPVGQFSHHRGIFTGWNHTNIGGESYDTWHMGDSTQEHQSWDHFEADDDRAQQVQTIHWKDEDGRVLVSEVRTITAHKHPDGHRIVDFESELTAEAGDIELRGDSHHAGVQIRLADEVTGHEDETIYTLQPGGEEIDNDEVLDAFWVMCSTPVADQRYWIIHMTPPTHPTGIEEDSNAPMYSIRRYARFGAFYEPDLTQGEPKTFQFRFVINDEEITEEEAEALYQAYSEEVQ